MGAHDKVKWCCFFIRPLRKRSEKFKKIYAFQLTKPTWKIEAFQSQILTSVQIWFKTSRYIYIYLLFSLKILPKILLNRIIFKEKLRWKCNRDIMRERKNMYNYLNSRSLFAFFIVESIFMHDPISSDPLWCPPSVVNQCLLHSYWSILWRNSPVFPRRFPVSRSRGSICSESIWVFSVSWTKKIPLWISTR